MEELAFRRLYDDIVALSASDGPARNVLEPKFTAREQMLQLKAAVMNAYTSTAHTRHQRRGCRHRALQQLCRCLTFLGGVMVEVDEADEGVVELRRAYRLAQWLCAHDEDDDNDNGDNDDDNDKDGVDVNDIAPVPLDDILAAASSSSSSCSPSAAHGFAGCVEAMLVHNALGVYLSARCLTDARVVLECAEAVYEAYDTWCRRCCRHCRHRRQDNSDDKGEDGRASAHDDDDNGAAPVVTCSIADVRIDDDGKLQQPPCEASTATPARCAACVRRFDMHNAYTNTCFFLAQVYTSLHATALASRACHLTLYLQLRGRQAFATKTWATNALQLSGFYSSRHEYGRALHCLQAAEHVMPHHDDNKNDNDAEETTGLLAWAFGRYYLHYLDYYSRRMRDDNRTNDRAGDEDDKARTTSADADNSSGDNVDGASNKATAAESFWLDFPDVAPPAQPQAAIATFAAARDVFKLASRHLKRALELHPFATSCVRHIEIRQDMVQLYTALAAFERDHARRVAMVQRQIDLLEALPSQLRFDAYPTLVRQLLFDVGTLYEELVRLHAQARTRVTAQQAHHAPAAPLPDAAYNALVDRALSFMTRFCDTWRSPQTQTVPDTLDADSRLPYFNALVHMAQLHTRYACANAKAEYDALGTAASHFARAVAFARRNTLADAKAQAQLAREVALAEEMASLVALKQRKLLLAHQRGLVC